MTLNAFENEFKGCVLLFINACLKLHQNAIIISNKTDVKVALYKQGHFNLIQVTAKKLDNRLMVIV